MRWAIVAVPISLFTACSFVRDLDGFSDGFGASDASSASDGSSVDAPADHTGTWCAAHADGATFCEDFDTDAGLTRFEPATTERGTVAIDNDAAAASSSPRSLLAMAPASSESGKVSVSKYGVVDATFAFVGADVRIEKVNAKNTSTAQPLTLFFEKGANAYQVGIGVTGQQRSTFAFEYDDPDATSFQILGSVPSIADGAFHRVELAVDLKASTLEVRIDGVAAPGLPKLAPGIRSGRALSIAGIAFADADHDGWTVRVDDITFSSR